MSALLSLISLCLVNIHLVDCYKILVFSPTISRSHMISNGRIADELAKNGHEVVLLEPDFLQIWDKVKIPVKYARRWKVDGFGKELWKAFDEIGVQLFDNPSATQQFKGWLAYQEAYNSLCKTLINNDQVIEELRKEKFDAYFGEQLNLCGHGLAHELGIKTHFWISSCPMHDYMAYTVGMPIPLSYVPSMIGIDQTTRPNYMERAKNILHSAIYILIDGYAAASVTNIYREKFGTDFPYINKIASDSDMIFVSTDEFINIPRPTLPNVVHIGGLGIEDKNQTLDKVFSIEMSKGEKGVIFFSFGSIVATKTLPPVVLQSVVNIAKKLNDYHFIIKADEDDKLIRDYAKGTDNVLVTDWVPQVALLAHPRLLMFITHAGYNGVMEAARAAVPLITMPFMFDQIQNSRAIELTGWGIGLRKECLINDPQQLEKAILEVATDSKYKAAAKRIQYLVRNKPFNASERLLKHVDFVLKAGGIKELLVEGRNMSLIHYHNIDIFVPLAIFLAILLFFSFKVSMFIFKFMWKTFCSSRKVKTN